MKSPDFLEIDSTRIAYHKLLPQARTADTDSPGVVFLGGFRSDMTGTKAQFLEDWAKKQGRAFLRFDYTGHGQSSGDFEEGSIGDWARDARRAIEALTEGPQILVGSSMGGWIALLIARALPERIAGLIGIAAAPDFTEDSMWDGFSPAQQTELMEAGRLELPSDYSDEPYVITQRLIEDGRNNLILREPLKAPFPVRLLQGMDDADVAWETAPRLAQHIEGPDIQAILIPGADHRMSEPKELDLLAQTLEALPV